MKQLQPAFDPKMNTTSKVEDTTLMMSIRTCIAASHGTALEGGWWHDPKTGERKDRNKGELIALMHSELSEALEGVRKDLKDEHLPEFKSVEVELADTLHRIFDFAGAFDLRLGEAFVAKMHYNAQRADHKPENRIKEGGKAF